MMWENGWWDLYKIGLTCKHVLCVCVCVWSRFFVLWFHEIVAQGVTINFCDCDISLRYSFLFLFLTHWFDYQRHCTNKSLDIILSLIDQPNHFTKEKLFIII